MAHARTRVHTHARTHTRADNLKTYCQRTHLFLPRDAMLARYCRAPACVCVSLSQVGVLSKETNGSG